MVRFIRHGFMSVVASLAFALTLATSPRVATAATPGAAAAATDPVDGKGLTFLCFSVCFHECDFWLAIYTDGSPKNNDDLPDFECIHFTCNSGCDWGSAPATVIASAIDAVTRDDMAEIGEILRRERGAHFNIARQSIQFEGCVKNTIVANIPLSVRQAAALDRLGIGSERRVALVVPPER